MEWKQLISAKRLTETVEPTAEDDRSPFQKDFDRIVFSSAFRRLKDKTQVHLLSPGDYVRTRLTHSLEASSVGRSLGSLVGKEVINHHKIEKSITFADFGHIVSAAALAHDIGNPPFGHSGEEAIHDWFTRDDIEEKILCRLSSKQGKTGLSEIRWQRARLPNPDPIAVQEGRRTTFDMCYARCIHKISMCLELCGQRRATHSKLEVQFFRN